MESYFGVAKETGISSEEIETIQAIVMAVAGGRVKAQFRVARNREMRKREARD